MTISEAVQFSLSQFTSRAQLQQILVEPGDGLAVGLLLGKLLDPVGEVAAHGKTVRDAREQVDLVREGRLLEDLLGLVAHVDGEDAVGLGGGDGEGAADGGQLVLGDEGGVGEEADVDAGALVELTGKVLRRKEGC